MFLQIQIHQFWIFTNLLTNQNDCFDKEKRDQDSFLLVEKLVKIRNSELGICGTMS